LNREAEEQAAEIRIRAERKTGELVKEGQRNGMMLTAAKGRPKASDDPTHISPIKTLADLGISRDQSSQWQKLAEIPKEQFEEALAADTHVIPSTAGVLEYVKPVVHIPPVKYDRDSLMAHGHIMDFRDIMLKPASELYSLMAQYQRDELAALIPKITAWLEEMR
jgi:hypothetical protein